MLLGISAVWCHWCHVMDETSYSDGEVIRLINESFVPIRVDNDQRPDINARYNMGGWPTTAFLTPDGEVMAGMTYVPPDQMRDVLAQVSTYFRDNRADIDAKIADIAVRRDAEPSASGAIGGELSDQILRDALHAANDAYDPVFGGFGTEPKFPHTEAIDLLLHIHLRDGDRDALHMARKTLEHMCGGGTYDQEWGGFYRYSTKRDWSVPHYEKMLEDNALILRNLLMLYRITREPQHRRYIDATIAYMDAWLSDTESGAFYGSQDADEAFYPLPAAERAGRPAPYVDRTFYTSWNAMAISAYVEASWTLDRRDLESRALRALDFLWERLYTEDSGVCRYLAPDGPHIAGLLEDRRGPPPPASTPTRRPAGRRTSSGLERSSASCASVWPHRAAPSTTRTRSTRRSGGSPSARRRSRRMPSPPPSWCASGVSRTMPDLRGCGASLRCCRSPRSSNRRATSPPDTRRPSTCCSTRRRRTDRRSAGRCRPADAIGRPRIGGPEPHRARNRHVGSRRAGTCGAASRPVARRIRLLRYALLGARYGARGSGRSYPENTCGVRANAPHGTARRPPWQRDGERLTARGGGP